MVDAGDSKSPGGNPLPVRVRPSAPINSTYCSRALPRARRPGHRKARQRGAGAIAGHGRGDPQHRLSAQGRPRQRCFPGEQSQSRKCQFSRSFKIQGRCVCHPCVDPGRSERPRPTGPGAVSARCERDRGRWDPDHGGGFGPQAGCRLGGAIGLQYGGGQWGGAPEPSPAWAAPSFLRG